MKIVKFVIVSILGCAAAVIIGGFVYFAILAGMAGV